MTISVKVLYFGQAREAAGTAEEVLSLPSGTSVRDVVRRSATAHEPLRGLSRTLKVAVNEEIAHPGDVLSDGDVVALLPPVAGG